MIPLFDLRGPEFLRVFMVLSAIACVTTGVLSVVFSRLRRRRYVSRAGAKPTLYEIAYAVGGPRRAVATVLDKFYRDGAFVHGGGNAPFRENDAATLTDWFERAVATALRCERRRPAAGAAMLEAASGLEAGAIRAGLLPSRPERLRQALIAVAPVAVTVLIGAIKTVIGIGRGKPVSLLILLMMVTAIMGVFAVRRVVWPRFGRHQIPESLRREMEASSETDQTAMRVALGSATGAVVAVWLASLYPGASLTGGDSGASGCSGGPGCGSGGGGGCGGGCGGCGGGH